MHRVLVSPFRAGKQGLLYLILDIQRAALFMQEFQGLHVAVSRRVVDSVGSALEVGEGEFQDLAVTFTPKIMLKNPALWECACSQMI